MIVLVLIPYHYKIPFPGPVPYNQATEGHVHGYRWRSPSCQDEPAKRTQVQIGQGGSGPRQESSAGGRSQLGCLGGSVAI